MNGFVVGEVKEDRPVLSLTALTHALGAPNRSQVQGDTQRITWDDAGVQLEATARESTAFALLFEFNRPDATDQGVIPRGQYQGTFDCVGIKLHSGVQIADLKSLLTAAGFNIESGSTGAESWSLRLEHWAVFLRFSADGKVDSAVMRVLPDIF